MTDKEKEIEKPDDVDEKVEKPEALPPEKMLPQSQVDKLMAKQRTDHAKELAAVKSDFDAFKKSIEDKAKEAEDAAKEKVEDLRKNVPEPIQKLLDGKSYVDQLAWLSDPANNITQSNIPPLPTPGGPAHKTPTIGTVI
jgi:SMC interacting uncharacterized protein involved in chromosome segregation